MASDKSKTDPLLLGAEVIYIYIYIYIYMCVCVCECVRARALCSKLRKLRQNKVYIQSTNLMNLNELILLKFKSFKNICIFNLM